MIVYDTIELKEAVEMKETANIVMRVDHKFLERIDRKWKSENFKTRTEYIMFLIRNDVIENKAV
jgi:metal-responsive CopG/Arc/MetJ family transcriptional regulator